jgi:hypothetical protein
MPGCITFETSPLEHEDQMQIMFESIRSGDGEGEVQSDGGGGGGEGDGEGGDTPKVRSTVDKRVEKRAAHYSPKGNKKTKNFRDQDEMKAPSKNSATSHVVDHVREEIASMLYQVIEGRAEEGSDEHYYSTNLLVKKEYRDVFITLKTPNGRLNWLRRAWEDR